MLEVPVGYVGLKRQNGSFLRAKIEREEINKSEARLLISFGYDAYLKDEVKIMEGARWLGYESTNPRKVWAVKDSERNRFQLLYLMGQNPYEHYDKPLVEYKSLNRKPYNHQLELIRFCITRRHCIIASEMGTGKTLTAIEVMEQSDISENSMWWIGPRSALASVKYEFFKWKAKVHPRFMTYEELKKIVENWTDGDAAPRLIIFDEASRIKNYTARRSQAAKIIADAIREEYGYDSYIILMTGTPAPRDPSDWFNLVETARPGFLREGTIEKFKNRLAKIEFTEGLGNGRYPKLVGWWDNPAKCQVCCKLEDDPNHDSFNMIEKFYHRFVSSKNEVSYLYERMSGLVIVKMKSECLDLPIMQYRTIQCKPDASLLRAASMIQKTASSTIKALTLLRELSDGFQYQETQDGMEKCPDCKGTLKVSRNVDIDEPDNPLDDDSLTEGKRAIRDEDGLIIGFKDQPLRIEQRQVDCEQCNGTGEVAHFIRTAKRIPSSKEDALIDLLDQYKDEGRMVTWAGFTDSVERCVEISLKQDWKVIRLDGRGWWSNLKDSIGKVINDPIELLMTFDNKKDYPLINFVGQPGAGGQGLNLTASSVEVYYSNTFKGEDRQQSEARIHRPGADHIRGCMIIDIINLPQDILVLDNLKKKKDLMLMTMGEMQRSMKEIDMNYQRGI